MGGRRDIGGCLGTSFRSKRWLSLDLCGLLGISFSWGVHIYALVVIATQLISNSWIASGIYFAVYLPVAGLALTSLYMAWTTDPGAVPMGARPLVTVRRASSASLGGNGSDSERSLTRSSSRRALRRCHKCHDNYKPPRAHHDSVTGRCIVKFDHYCPWVNNAVGALNHKFFCLFLLYTAVSCLLSLLLLLVRAVHCGYLAGTDDDDDDIHSATSSSSNIHVKGSSNTEEFHNDADTSLGGRELWFDTAAGGNADATSLSSSSSAAAAATAQMTTTSPYLYHECDHFYDNHLVLGLFVASLVFLVFTCSMGCEQLEAIESGQGKIARMKMRVGHAGTEFARVTEEFNEMFGGRTGPKPALHWFVPTAVQFPGSTKKVVLGYEWDDSLPAVPYQENGSSDALSLCSSSGSMDDSNNINNGRMSSDVEMEELENGRRKKKKRNSDASLTGVVPVPPSSTKSAPATMGAGHNNNHTMTRQMSDLSRGAESQQSNGGTGTGTGTGSTRNRRLNSRLSSDHSMDAASATSPRIV